MEDLEFPELIKLHTRECEKLEDTFDDLHELALAKGELFVMTFPEGINPAFLDGVCCSRIGGCRECQKGVFDYVSDGLAPLPKPPKPSHRVRHGAGNGKKLRGE